MYQQGALDVPGVVARSRLECCSMNAARPTDERVTSRLRAMASRIFPERVGFVWGALTNVVTTTVAFDDASHMRSWRT